MGGGKRAKVCTLFSLRSLPVPHLSPALIKSHIYVSEACTKYPAAWAGAWAPQGLLLSLGLAFVLDSLRPLFSYHRKYMAFLKLAGAAWGGAGWGHTLQQMWLDFCSAPPGPFRFL